MIHSKIFQKVNFGSFHSLKNVHLAIFWTLNLAKIDFTNMEKFLIFPWNQFLYILELQKMSFCQSLKPYFCQNWFHEIFERQKNSLIKFSVKSILVHFRASKNVVLVVFEALNFAKIDFTKFFERQKNSLNLHEINFDTFQSFKNVIWSISEALLLLILMSRNFWKIEKSVDFLWNQFWYILELQKVSFRQFLEPYYFQHWFHEFFTNWKRLS